MKLLPRDTFMSALLVQISLNCAICGTENKFINFVRCYNSRENFPDLDLRPGGSSRHFFKYLVQECDECGYVSNKIDQADQGISLIMESKKYRSLQKNKRLVPLSVSFLKLSCIHEYLGDKYQAGIAALSAAWVLDDNCDIQSAVEARLRAARLLLAVIRALPDDKLLSSDTIKLKAVAIDVLRRARLWSDAKYLSRSLLELPVDSETRIIGEFQEFLSERQNSRCYNISEITQDIS